jgi:prepilin-type N-terminal cleavage/methylation domain-containing protein
MKKNYGFTLLELIVVISILSVFTTLSVPPMLKWRQEARLKTCAQDLKSDLTLAKMKAIYENQKVAVLFTESQYLIFLDNGNGGGVAQNWNQDGSEKTIIRQDLPPGISIDLEKTTMNNDRTRFNAMGFNEVTGQISLINVQGESMTIDMSSRVGRIRII